MSEENEIIFENILNPEQERILETFDELEVALALVSQEGIILSANENFGGILGYSSRELMQKDLYDLTYIECFEKGRKENPFKGLNKIKFVKKDGTIIWVDLKTTQHYNTPYDAESLFLLSIADATTEKELENVLKEVDTYYSIFKYAVDPIILTDQEWKILDANLAVEDLFGYSRQELLDCERNQLVDVSDPHYQELLKKVNHGGKIQSELSFLKKDGSKIIADVSIRVSKDRNGDIKTAILIKDLTRYKKEEIALKESEKRFKMALENSEVAVYSQDKDLVYTKFYNHVTNFNPQEVIGKTDYDLYPLKEADQITQIKNKVLNEGIPLEKEIEVTRNQKKLYYNLIVEPDFDDYHEIIGISCASMDITSRKNAEQDIKNSLNEKKLLLREIHHRVKNNLMIISSLLSLQADYIKDPETLEIFRESRNRTKSMAIIHEKLYQTENLEKIDFSDYAESLIKDLFQSYQLGPQVKLEMNMDEIMLDVNTAVPLGLIVNELVSNSMKYAFEEGESGQINVNFYKDEDKFVLEVSDDGLGFPEDLDYENTDSLGLQLVTNLTRQLDGEISLHREPGTTFEIVF